MMDEEKHPSPEDELGPEHAHMPRGADPRAGSSAESARHVSPPSRPSSFTLSHCSTECSYASRTERDALLPKGRDAILSPKGHLNAVYGGEDLGLRKRLFNTGGCDGDSRHKCQGADLLLSSTGKHYPFLDITRVACVWCVAIDHGNGSFGRYNVMFTQDWVLQYLFIVAGASFGMTKKSLFSYEFRLAMYFGIGVVLNWLAWIITGGDWRHSFADVVFHLWFVVGLMVYSMILAPLRAYLKSTEVHPKDEPNREPEPEAEMAHASSDALGDEEQGPNASASTMYKYRDSLLFRLAVVGGGLVAIGLFFSYGLDKVWRRAAPAWARTCQTIAGSSGWGEHWGFPETADEAIEHLHRLSLYLMCNVSNAFLMTCGPHVLPKASWTTCIMLINTYGHKLLVDRKQDDRFFHGLDLTMLGMAAFYLGLRHRQRIGTYIVRYWFLLIFVCTIIWPPGAGVRYDENPPPDVELRVRVNLLEAIFTTVWLVAADRLVQAEIFTEDCLEFLGTWALLVFLVHKAVHIVLPHPLNWTFLLVLIPVCKYYESWRRRDSEKDQVKGA